MSLHGLPALFPLPMDPLPRRASALSKPKWGNLWVISSEISGPYGLKEKAFRKCWFHLLSIPASEMIGRLVNLNMKERVKFKAR